LQSVPDRTSLKHGPSQPSDACEPATRDERRLVELNGYVIRSCKTIVDVKVLDLSYDGCSITTLVPLSAGEKVKLSVLGRGAISASVRWYTARKAGLLFETGRVGKTKWPRKEERVKVIAEVSLRRSGRLSYRVSTFEMTRFGCSCEFVERPAVYERLWVKFDGLDPIEATVCWVESSSLGLMYTHPVHPAVFDLLLARLNSKPVGGSSPV
jgi:hypothetical protein